MSLSGVFMDTRPESLTEHKMSPEVKKLIDQAMSHQITPKEAYEQRVSFVYGNLNPKSRITREKVKKVLAEQGYVDPDLKK